MKFDMPSSISRY